MSVLVAIREFVAPTYRPECHYMRGPGPACARREKMRSIDPTPRDGEARFTR